MEKQGWKTLGITFIVLFLIACLFGWWQGQIIKDNSTFYSNSLKQYQEDYDYKCSEGYTNKCIKNGYQYYEYNSDTQTYPTTCKIGEYTSQCFDPKFQTSTVCNKLDGYFATCQRDGTTQIKCPAGAYANCQDTTTGKWVSSI